MLFIHLDLLAGRPAQCRPPAERRRPPVGAGPCTSATRFAPTTAPSPTTLGPKTTAPADRRLGPDGRGAVNRGGRSHTRIRSDTRWASAKLTVVVARVVPAGLPELCQPLHRGARLPKLCRRRGARGWRGRPFLGDDWSSCDRPRCAAAATCEQVGLEGWRVAGRRVFDSVGSEQSGAARSQIVPRRGLAHTGLGDACG